MKELLELCLQIKLCKAVGRGKKLKIRVAFEQRDGGVFHLDDVFKRIIVRVGANARRLTANP